MYFDMGTLDGLISNLFVFGPWVIGAVGLRHLIRRGFFGPHQR